MNTFIVLGFAGISVTLLIQLLMVFALNQNFESWWVFYIVWFVFLIIGIGIAVNKKKERE